MDNFLYVSSFKFLFRLLRILACKMRKCHLRKVCGEKKNPSTCQFSNKTTYRKAI